MSDETTLLPCPFCGGKAALHMSWMGDGYRYRAVKCVECGATTPGNYSEVGDQSAWDWNTRATHGTLTAEQVRETVEKHWHDLPDEYDMPEATALPEYSYDWHAIADELNELGSGTKPCYAADENYKRCKYSVNRGWCDDAPFLVWDDTGHLFITMGGLKTWDVTDDVKKWFAELGSWTCEWPTDVEGQRIQIADTIHMIRTEYDGDHEWEDVVIELVYVEYGGDKWIVRGARGEAWACECTVTGHDDELYDNSDDWSNLPTPWDRPEPDGWYKCPNPSCGCVVGYSLLADDSWTIYMDDYQIPFNHCPNCGRKVVSA